MDWFRKRYKWLIFYSVTYILLMLFFVFPLQYELLLPGGVQYSNVVSIDNAYETNGSFNSSYVSVVTRPSPFQFLLTKLNSRVDVIELSESASDLSLKEMNYKSNLYKISSVNAALIAAYNQANKNLVYQENGVVIIDRIYETPAYDKINIGDIIVKINNQEIKNYHDLTIVLEKITCQELFTMTVKRNTELIKLTISKQPYENTCIIGIHQSYTFTDYKFDYHKSEPKIKKINYAGFGPSAGLIQALSIYNMVTPSDITYGLKIAGTGTIDEAGNVGPIGGIKQKIFGACKDQVDIFFTPKEHYEAAISAREIMKSDLIIVSVNTLSDAINYLRENYG